MARLTQETVSVTYGAILPEEEEPPSVQAFRDQQQQRRRSSLSESMRLIVDSSFAFGGSSSSIRDFEGHASPTSEVFNMAKNLVGAGVLSLSGGIAIYANARTAVVSASFWIVLFGAIFGYFCLLIAKVCRMTGSATYRECWESTMGANNGAVAVSLVNALKPALGNLAYSAILSQTMQSLLETVGIALTRVQCLFLLTVAVLLPLCLLKNLHVLAPFSILGTVGVIVTAIAMTIRLVDGSYQPGGLYFDDMDPRLQPDFGRVNEAWSPRVLPFVCMVFESWVMHYNAPRFYVELKDASIPRFGMVVFGSFGLSAVIYVAIAGAGYLTFGGNSNGFILNNYSPHDPLATLCRVLIAISTTATYPIVFVGFRDGILDVLEVPPSRHTSNNINMLTIVLLSIITLLAVVVTDLGLINAVGGGTLATALVFCFPALMFRSAVRKRGERARGDQQREVVYALVLMAVGVVLGLIGVLEALQ